MRVAALYLLILVILNHICVYGKKFKDHFRCSSSNWKKMHLLQCEMAVICICLVISCTFLNTEIVAKKVISI